MIHLSRKQAPADALDALAAATAGRVGLPGVLASLSRRARPVRFPRLLGRAVRRAFTWDAADRRDPRWWPQGITGTGDAGAPELAAGRDLLVTSSYSKTIDGATHGSRLTVVDLATLRYEHVLLVEAQLVEGRLELKPLRVHAGGIVWHGPWVHVAATGRGFVSCHWDDVVELTPDTDMTMGTTALAGLGFRHLLPVRVHHRGEAAEGVTRLRYSFMSLARTPQGEELVIGEYGRGQQTRRVARIPLDEQTGLPAYDEQGRSRPLEPEHGGVARLQGAVVVDGRWYATASVGPVFPGSMYVGRPGALRARHLATPIGPEDLTHDPGSDLLWTVTEHPRRRWVCAMPRGWFG